MDVAELRRARDTREVNRRLRVRCPTAAAARLTEPRGRHNLAVGLTDRDLDQRSTGNAGYFLGGLGGDRDGSGPDIVVNGFVGWSVGENLMGGSIRVHGQRVAERRLERPGRDASSSRATPRCGPGSPSRAPPSPSPAMPGPCPASWPRPAPS